MHLARGEVETRGIAKRVAAGVDLGGQPPLGFADAFSGFFPPFEPAEC
jgi:hypothetical protein